MSDRPTPETDAKASPHIGFYSGATVPANFARDLERERDEAREVSRALADIAFKHLTSLLASTPHSKDAAHEEETQGVIAAIKLWKELKR